MIKHKDKWLGIIQECKAHNLTMRQMVFVLALLEVEDRPKDSEFNVAAAHGAGFKEQLLWVIGSVKKNQERWQKYLIGDYLEMIIPCEEFFFKFGGSLRTGWHTEHKDFYYNKFLKKRAEVEEDESIRY